MRATSLPPRLAVLALLALAACALGNPCVPPVVEEEDGGGVCVGCSPTTPGAFPYFVALTTAYNRNGVHCGGTLITPDVVVTAAHCVRWFLRAQVGRTNLDQEEYGEYTVTHVQRHPGHDPLTEDLDVALLKLDRPVDGAELATLVAAESSEMLENFLQSKDMSVMGFGKTLERGLLSKKLLAGTVQHVPRAECNSAERFGGQVTSNMLCAQGDGVDACDGDSGGPLILSRNSRDFLVGVVSWGIGCGGPKYPGVYVDINAVRPWILEEIDNSGQWPEVK
eukprot:jgi/Tetstr1/422122/TSEL_012978.t1